MENLRVLSIGWENTQQNSRNIQPLGNQKILGWNDQFILSGSRNFLDWQKLYKIYDFLNVDC